MQIKYINTKKKKSYTFLPAKNKNLRIPNFLYDSVLKDFTIYDI